MIPSTLKIKVLNKITKLNYNAIKALYKQYTFYELVISALRVYSALRGQKMVSDPLELELKMVVHCHVGTGNQIWVLCRSSKCS